MKEKTAADCRKGCVYAGGVGGNPCCNYILVEGHPRGCPPGKECDKYKKGKRKKVFAEEGF